MEWSVAWSRTHLCVSSIDELNVLDIIATRRLSMRIVCRMQYATCTTIVRVKLRVRAIFSRLSTCTIAKAESEKMPR